jgi:hypothetical protein
MSEVVEERRTALDPHPPPGCPERRNCSDPECRKARKDWFEEEVLPKIRIQIWIAIFAAVGACSGIFLYLNDSSITKHELKVKDIYETQEHHNRDMSEIRTAVDSLGDRIISMLDRNYRAIDEHELRDRLNLGKK